MHEKLILIFILINLPIVIFYNKITNIINIIDYRDDVRKFHKNNVPLFGGILLTYNIIIFSIIDYSIGLNPINIFSNTREQFSFFWGLLMCFIVGLYDDKFNLSPIKKLFLNFFIIFVAISIDDTLVIKSLSFSFLEYPIELNNISNFFTILCILLFINALNMFDGINFQAATYCIIIFTLLLFKNVYSFYCFILILSLSLFLIYNFKNKCFLGDSGTQFLSFLISYIFIKTYNIERSIEPEEIFIILSFPGLDMFRLFLLRIFNGKHPFSPDTNHMHHLIKFRYNFFYAFLIIQVMIILNILLYYILDNKLISLSSCIFSYIILFLVYRNNKGQKI